MNTLALHGRFAEYEENKQPSRYNTKISKRCRRRRMMMKNELKMTMMMMFESQIE